VNSLSEIKAELKSILSAINSSDEKTVTRAFKRYNWLVDRFYNENKNMLAPQQYKAAKSDFEYFMALVELAIAHWEGEKKNLCTPQRG
jgi:hypothetical protein